MLFFGIFPCTVHSAKNLMKKDFFSKLVQQFVISLSVCLGKGCASFVYTASVILLVVMY